MTETRRGAARMLARPSRAAALAGAGLDDPRRWRELLGQGAPGGRGRTACIELDGGTLRLKQLRRGGLAARAWRERFVGTRRLLANLTLPDEVARRGVPTPAAVALLLVGGPPGLYRGWLALEELAGAVDLAARVEAGDPPDAGELTGVLALVRRMHDRGVEHRDLNLGNLLVRRDAGGAVEAFLVDLDGVRLHAGPLGFAARQRALRRLERSWVKHAGRRIADAERDRIYALYAADDAGLRRRLERGRAAGRLRILAHRLGWRASSRP